jgi:nucleotide-binding universal stress UspA family protein
MNRLKRVLCPIDVRQPSRGAISFAAALAEEFESVLDAVYVSERHDSHVARLFAPRMNEGEKAMATHNLTEELTSLVGAGAPRVQSTAEVRWGRPLQRVLAEASRRRSDLIVVGAPDPSSSWRCTTRFADALASDAPCPVLTVPDRDSPWTPSRILLGIDLSEATDAAVEWTNLLASRFDASVEVLHAQRSLAGAPSELRKIESRFGRSGVRAEMRASRGASVLADIVERDTDDAFELVVIGIERGGAGRLDASFVERLRKLLRTPVLSIAGKALPQPMRSPRDSVIGLGALQPSALGAAADSRPAA